MANRSIHCKHFRAMSQADSCAAGVAYESLKGKPFGEWPCIVRRDQGPKPGCDLAVFPTPEEIAAEDAEVEAYCRDVDKARKAIIKASGGPWRNGMPSVLGAITCPVCGDGKLDYSRAGHNGHVHASCSTPKCVRWME